MTNARNKQFVIVCKIRPVGVVVQAIINWFPSYDQISHTV